jgi:hypothetical protein
VTWSLTQLLASLHDDIEQRLEIARRSFAHPVTKGDSSESVWLDLLQTYLPKRYQVAKAHVVDSKGAFSDQIDVVIFDRQYSPFIFRFNDQSIIPAESVYAAFEAKQSISAAQITYAQQKLASVRKLHRTSLAIPHAGGKYAPKPLHHVLGGLLTFESDWTPALGDPLISHLNGGDSDGRLDLGCIAAHGYFVAADGKQYEVSKGGKPATAFLFRLISLLQATATVPMIDVQAYGAWLSA